MKRFLILILGAVFALQSSAGTIVGVVKAEGKESEGEGGGGKYDSRKFKFAERVRYEELRDFVVFIEGPVEGGTTPTLQPVQVITRKTVSQKGAVFSPHVIPVLVGTTVEWPNEDEIFHNVFSISEAKEFDLGLYKKPEVKKVTFDKPGRVDVFCSIHSTMNCIVMVLENRFFSLTDDKGRYTIPEIPPGTYQLKAWHERLPSQRQTVTIGATNVIRIDFVLGPGRSGKN